MMMKKEGKGALKKCRIIKMKGKRKVNYQDKRTKVIVSFHRHDTKWKVSFILKRKKKLSGTGRKIFI